MNATTTPTWPEILSQPASSHLDMIIKGEHRVINQTRCCTIGELLAEAEAAGGVVGGDNKPVSRDTPIRAIFGWHADWDWGPNL